MNACTPNLRWLAVLGVLIVAVGLTACDDTPTPVAETPASTATPTPPPTPTVTPSPSPVPTATPTPDALPLSLGEYAERCSGFRMERQGENVTNEEFSAALGETIAAMESTTPPAEVAEWHAGSLALFRAMREQVDGQPGGETVNPSLLLSVLPLAEAVRQAESRMDEVVREELAAAGCITPQQEGA